MSASNLLTRVEASSLVLLRLGAAGSLAAVLVAGALTEMKVGDGFTAAALVVASAVVLGVTAATSDESRLQRSAGRIGLWLARGSALTLLVASLKAATAVEPLGPSQALSWLICIGAGLVWAIALVRGGQQFDVSRGVKLKRGALPIQTASRRAD